MLSAVLKGGGFCMASIVCSCRELRHSREEHFIGREEE
jgi:hypothetical protein